MPTFLIVVLSIVGLIAAVCGLALQFLATGAANGGTYALMKWGEGLFGFGAAMFAGFGLWALARWAGWYAVAALLIAMYVWGSVMACRRITRSTKEYDTGTLVKGALFSWFGVMLMDVDVDAG
jgi:hypothetical protein